MSAVVGPAPCKACRMPLWYFDDRNWYEDRLGFRWHTAKRCAENVKKTAA